MNSSLADAEAIQHLKQAVAGGKHWYIALLEAIGLWGSPEEVHDGKSYRYLIDGEAFDWLLLAERLCCEIDSLIAEEEMIDLLFLGIPPVELSREEFGRLIGDAKYRAYLNYFYGVTVEEALVAVVEEDVYRERMSLATARGASTHNEAFRRVYGADMGTLLDTFRQDNGHPALDSITLAEAKEFTYWLFKYRLDNSDKARVASDTKKALQWLQRQWSSDTRGKAARPLQI